MRALALLVLAAALAGCSANPCDGLAGSCVAVELTGSLPRGDRFDVGVHQGAASYFAQVADPHEGEASLPVRFAILLPSDLSGPLAIDIAMKTGATIVGVGSGAVTVPPSGQLVEIELAGVGDGFGVPDGFQASKDGGDDLGPGDLAVPDLGPPRTTAFAGALSYPVGSLARSVAVADVDGDGHADVIVGAHEPPDKNIATLRGQGDGTLAAPVWDKSVGVSPAWIGELRIRPSDPFGLLAVLYATNSVVMLSRAGAFGTYQVAQTFSASMGAAAISPFTAVITHLDGDGLRDVVVGGYHDTAPADTYVYRGAVTGNLSTLAAPIKVENVGRAHPVSYLVAAGDLDGDQDVDLLIAGSDPADPTQRGRGLRFVAGDGAGGFSSPLAVHLHGDNTLQGVLVGQFIPGGADEVIEITSSDVTVLGGSPLGGYTHGPRLGDGASGSAAITGDWNGDGLLDFAIAYSTSATDGGTQGGSVRTFTGDGQGGFVVSGPLAVDDAPYTVAAGDLDGDGLPELVTASYPTGTISVLKNVSK